MTDAPDSPPEPSKLTRSKQRWAEEGRFLTGHPVRSGEQRLPPGQHWVKDWPVLDLGAQPTIAPERWSLAIGGMVRRPATLDWAALRALPAATHTSDIHCVTSWSRQDNRWEGVSTRTLLDLAEPKDEAAAVMLHAADGYTTNLPLADFAADDALLAWSWEGQPLSRAHGGPVRLVVPHLYFWKSARITLMGRDASP
jgi:DMSO/TMAO reductase YedYZ molybdopterin-dependent catalytic subunit